jgi:hypothetical protein
MAENNYAFTIFCNNVITLTHKTFASDSIAPVRITMGESFSLLILAVYPGNHTPPDNLNARRTRDTLR